MCDRLKSCSCVCDFISFIVAVVFNFNGNARIHATDPIHWITFSICKAISNIWKRKKKQQKQKHISFHRAQLMLANRSTWYLNRNHRKIDAAAVAYTKCTHSTYGFAKTFTWLKRRYFVFVLVFVILWLTLQLFAKFSHFLCIHLWLRLYVGLFRSLLLFLYRWIYEQTSLVDKHKLISCHFAWDSQ